MSNKEIITRKDEHGEVIDNREFDMRPGDILTIKVTRKESIDSWEAKQELVQDLKEFIEGHEGPFVHLIFRYGQPIFKELEERAPGNKSNIHVIRFMMLTTCLTFGGNLFDSNKNRVKKSSLKRLWDTTNKNSINETYNLLLECGYIYETEEGYLMLNEDLVIKGAVTNLIKDLRKDDVTFTCTRLFVNNIRDMYYGTTPSKRKQLANLFKILPYLNYKHNVFCSNPTETDEEKVEPLTWTDLARLCGEHENNVTRFKKDLWNLKIYGYDVVGQFTTGSGVCILFNPRMYYSGSDLNDIMYLYDLFNMGTEVDK